MSEDKQRCPICDQGDLETLTESRTMDELGAEFTVGGLKYQVCSNCGVKQVGAAELRQNKQLIMAARKRAKNLLTGEEVREVRKSLGLTQQQAADYFGGGTNAFSKYETEKVEQNLSMDRFLRVAFVNPSVISILRTISENTVSDVLMTVTGLHAPLTRRDYSSVVTSGTSTNVISLDIPPQTNKTNEKFAVITT